MRTRILTCAAALVLTLVVAAVGLAACGGEDEPAAPAAAEPAEPDTGAGDTGAAETGAAEAAAETITPLGPVTDEPVTLTIWTPGEPDGGSEGRRQLDAAFTAKYPNITIEHTGFDWSTLYGAKLRTAIAAKKGPNVVWMYGAGWVQSSGYEKALRPLYDIVSPSLREELAFVDGYEVIDEGLYALPFGTYGYVWYFNKQLFAQAGLDPEAPPETWDDLVGACEALANAGITPVAAGFKDGYLGGWYHYFGFASQTFSPEEIQQWNRHEIGWTDEGMTTSLEYLVAVQQAGCFGDAAFGRTLADTDPMFRGGKAAMIYWTNLNGNELEEQLGEGNVGVFTMPGLPESDYPENTIDAGANGGWSITNFEPDKCRAAWEYVSFALSQEGQELMWQYDHQLPNNLAVTVEADNALDQQILEWLKNPANHGGPSPSAQEASVEVRLWAPLIQGDLSVEGFAEQMQKARDKAPPVEVYAQPDPEPCE